MPAWASRSRLGKRLTRAALGIAAFALASSVLATPRRAATSAAPPVPLQVVVVTLDGARYQEIFQGVDAALAARSGVPKEKVVSAERLVPNLHALMHEYGAALGAPGSVAPISASGPDFVSLPGYSEIFTGRRVTGCRNNSCRGTASTSIADQLAQQDPTARAGVITSWPDIAKVASRSDRVDVSAGRHGGATRERLGRSGNLAALLTSAESTTPWPGNDDFRRDRYTAELALAYLQEQKPRFLFVGLGETDEFAHQGNYAGYLDALREADQRVGELWRALEAARATGTRTALFVTADHGRAAGFRDHGAPHPESARVWLVASGSAIPARGWVAARAPRYLADVAPTLRVILGLRPDSGQSAGTPMAELLGLTAATGE